MCLFQLWFSQDICPGVELLSHMVILEKEMATVQEGSLFSTSPVFHIIDHYFWFENIVVKYQNIKPNSCLVKMFSIHNIIIFFRSSEFLGCQIFLFTKMQVLNSFLKIMDYFGLCTPLMSHIIRLYLSLTNFSVAKYMYRRV